MAGMPFMLTNAMKDALRSRGLPEVEIGAAFTQRKPIFLAFSDRNIADRFYFIEQPADISVVARSAPTAWKLFTHWREAE
jgi:hypothetical protein